MKPSWYEELELDDYPYDVSEEVILSGEFPVSFAGKEPALVQVEFVLAPESEEQIDEITEPTTRQKEIWETYLQQQENIHTEILQAIHTYYMKIEDQYRQAYAGQQAGGEPLELESIVPHVTRPQELLDYIELNGCLIQSAPGVGEMYLNFHCTWDTEHGLGVKLSDWHPSYIGGAYTLYDL
ncbi:DUF6985 domain-containing protein [Paenibacillus wulumuqiensis]|uniref:DUF6985 domain-containing protein n=1 Tax=Paenibacillus wulumuqiensis TaxID=1567107 RepID=UPI00069688D9|nr:hypothetical protein [Paenibacillus wulumuqiensis]